MAAYLNRTISMVAANVASTFDNNSFTDSSSTTARSMLHHGNATNENSPLQIFVKAKRRINDIFGEIEEYVIETARFIDGKQTYQICYGN